MKLSFLIALATTFNAHAKVVTVPKIPNTPDFVRHKTNADIMVKGVVTDDQGNKLPGTSVSVKGVKGIGVSTDSEGRFTLKVPDNSILVFSNIGFETLEKPAASSMSVILKVSDNKLDEVIVVAYGTSTKRTLNSAVSTLDMANVAPLPVQSINDGVAGRIQGVIVTSSSGAPGAKSTISIRGGGTPLYVIDNQIRTQSDFQNLNPNDIETYSVLKDVGATALYGQQGGNGIVLVTTKKGKEGKVDINYSYNTIFSKPTLFPEKLGSYETLSAINQVYIAEGRPQPTTDASLELYRNQSDPYKFPNTNWQKVGLKNHALEQRHDFSITSGSELLKYFASGSYYDQGSNLRTDQNYNRRATYRLNTESNFEKINLKVIAGIDGYLENNSVPLSSSAGGYVAIFQHIQQQKPYNLAYNEFGLPYNTGDNPAVELSPLSGYNRNNNKVLNTLLTLQYTAPFLQGLSLKATGSYNVLNSTGKSWNYSAPTYALDSKTAIPGPLPALSAYGQEDKKVNLQAFINYSRVFGDHTIDIAGVFEKFHQNYSSVSASRRNYQILFDQFVAGPTIDQTGSGSEYEFARSGLIGRIGYNYKSKYFAEFNIRRDGNAAFPTNNQWGTFSSGSLGYIISEENFMKSLKDKHILDYLKIRGSYGLVGQLGGAVDANGRSLYSYIAGYGVNANAWTVNGNLVQGTSEPGSFPSINYSWFNIKERNIGLDLATLNNRLSASMDYFYKRTTGYVAPDPRFASTLGIGLPPINFKDAANRREGTEFNLTWNEKVRDFSYKVGLNFTYFNELWERTFSEDETALKNPYTRISGRDGGVLQQGYHNLGFYTNNGDLLTGSRRIASINTVAGDLKYEDTNGDGKIDGSDQRNIGKNTFPRVNYGLTVDLGYKGFFLSTVIMGSGNRDRYLSSIIQGTSAQGILIYDFQRNYWRPDNQNPLFPRQVSNAGQNGSNNVMASDFWLLQSKFVRLKYLQFGYDFKAGALKKSPFKSFKLFVSGTNLLTSSKAMDYFVDPESNAANEDYPIQRTVALGLNIGF